MRRNEHLAGWGGVLLIVSGMCLILSGALNLSTLLGRDDVVTWRVVASVGQIVVAVGVTIGVVVVRRRLRRSRKS